MLLAVLVATFSVPGGHAQGRPLPDRERFLAEVRTRLDRDEDRQAGYTYTEKRTRLEVDGSGHVRTERVDLIESYPGLPGEPRWERPLTRNGRSVSAAELARLDADRQKTVERYARQQAARSPRARQRDDDATARSRREMQARVDDVFRVYDLKMLGRESIEGHDTIAFSMNPLPDANPRTREGHWMRAFRGRGWVSESDFELVKLEVEAIDDVSLGLGLLARVHKGTTFAFQRRKINGERWLPAFSSYTLSARIMLLKRLRQRGTTEYSNYRAFGVDTTTTIAPLADNP